MKRKIIHSIILLAVVSLWTLPAMAQSEIVEAIDKNGAQKHVLDNGLIVIIKEDHSSPLVAVEARVRVGSANEGEFAGSGVSHFVEHMLFKGTASRRVGEIEKEIKSYGGTISGFTSYDYSGYQFVVLKEYFANTLDILKDALFSSSLDPKELERERDVILKEIRLNRDEPTRRLSRLLWSTTYRTHPYRHPIIGYQDLFSKLTRQDLLTYYKKMYIPNNMIVTVVGDIDAETAYAHVVETFGDVKRGTPPATARPIEKRQISKRVLEETDNIKLAYFGLGFRSVDIFSEDLFALDVLAIILGHGGSSRLNQKLYREKELLYSVGTWNYTPKDPGIFIVSGVTDPKKAPIAIKAILDEIDSIKKDGVNSEELEKAKNSVISSFVSSRETISGQLNDLASSELTTGDYNFSRRYIKGVEAVTDDNIKKAALKYLGEESLSVITLLPQDFKKEPTGKTQKSEPDNYKISKYTLPNGIKVLLREDHRLPLVSIRVSFNGGLRTENETTNGISNLTATMLLKGTDSRTEEEISETVESLGGGIGYTSGNNSLGISLGLLSKDTDVGLDLVEDILASPSFPPEILEREKNSVLAAIKSEEDDIYQFAIRLLKGELFKTHPYRFRVIGEIDSVKNIVRDDIINYYKSWCRPDNMVLSVFGDIEIQKILAKIEEKFSRIKKGVAPPLDIKREKRLATKRQIHRTLNKAQSIVMLGFQGTTIYDKDKYALAVISSILSGKSGRLSLRLREKLGLAYALGSFSAPGIEPGYYLFYVGTSSGNISTVKKELLKQVNHLSRKHVTAKELELAKKELLGRHKISLQTNSALAFRSTLDELYGLGYNDYLKFSESIKTVTVEDVLRVAQKYLNPEAYVLSVVEGKR